MVGWLCAFVLSHFSCVQLFARQAPLSLGFPRQEYGSEVPFPSPEDLPDPGIEPASFCNVSCTGRQILYPWCYLGSLSWLQYILKALLTLELAEGVCKHTLLVPRAGR